MSEYVTVKDNLDYQNVSIEIEGEEVLVLCEIDVSVLQEVCLVDCGKFNSENKLYKLDNGQYAAQPNNRIIWRDQSLIPDSLK